MAPNNVAAAAAPTPVRSAAKRRRRDDPYLRAVALEMSVARNSERSTIDTLKEAATFEAWLVDGTLPIKPEIVRLRRAFDVNSGEELTMVPEAKFSRIVEEVEP
jgi:hypothetical protein